MTKLSALRPPVTEITPAIRWVLEAAFSATGPTESCTDLHPELESIASRLGLVERIAARPAARDLADDVRDLFRQRLNRSAATCLLYEDLAHTVAGAAATLSTPIVFLKGFALFLLELAPAGARPFGDLDVLVRADAAQQLFDALCQQGFIPVPGAPTEQHLVGLRSPRGGLLEIHFALRGLLDDNGRPSTLDNLAGWNALGASTQFDAEAYLPVRGLLAAHLLVHAVQQHLLRPQTYALFRVIGDLSDLLPTQDDWNKLVSDWSSRYKAAASPIHVAAIQELCRDLGRGSLPDATGRSDPERLLGHLLAGALDRTYADSLATRYLRDRLGEAGRRGELGEYVRRKILPSAGSSATVASGESLFGRLTRVLGRQLRALMNRLRLR